MAEAGLGHPSPQSGGWIESPAFDLAFFILSPLAGLMLLLATTSGGNALLALAAATLIGGPHYLATYSFYFWDDTAAYQRQRWVAYFVVPLLIVAAVGVIAWLRLPAIIALVIYFWNAYHVSRQSCGILSIYRHRAGVFDPRQKTIANTAIIWTNLAMAMFAFDWYQPLLSRIQWFPALHDLLATNANLSHLLWLGVASAAIVALTRLGIALVQRYRHGPALGAVELAFLATSLLLFHPYLWVSDANLATLGMLLGHFIQYLGIVWILHRRKFADGTGSQAQRWLSRLWRDPWVLVPALLLAGSLFMVLQINLMAVTIALVLLHFYLDALFWAFKRPEVRKAITPHLMSGGRQTVVAGPGRSIADVKVAHEAARQ